MSERVLPYTDKLFRQAAIEWLVATDQPLQALEHPKFKDMIDVAARATNGVKLPGRRATRSEIKATFKTNLMKLKVQLNVCIPAHIFSHIAHTSSRVRPRPAR